ncbi:MAG: peptidoglycan editing factor PgeF [Peptococcia bacterium]
MDKFLRQTANDLVYYTIPSFSATGLVVNGFSGRKGGVSPRPYESLNLSLLTDDKPENVLENRRRFTEALGIKTENLVSAKQVHGAQIVKVNVAHRGKGSCDSVSAIPGTDALMTNEKGLALMAFFADCVPVLFLDPVKKAIAISHAGWKGTVARIAAKTVKAMQEAYGTEPSQLLAAIGPSVGPCHYEVDEPVIAKFKEAFPGKENQLMSYAGKAGHRQLNLWEANVLQLKEAGLKEGNITVAGLCTFCQQEEFFSHRAGMAGRQAAVLMLR